MKWQELVSCLLLLLLILIGCHRVAGPSAANQDENHDQNWRRKQRLKKRTNKIPQVAEKMQFGFQDFT